jgi:DNA end-binding protein Ku
MEGSMARPIWKGNISFGLVNIPVNLFTAEKPSEQIHLHLLDKKTHSRIHNQRVNEQGKEVAWDDIEHAYEFEKGKYVIVDQKMLEKTAANNYETVEISEFVPLAQIDPIYFEKPYFLLPGEAGVKGYILLHDILLRTKKVGIANVVIKTREHMAAILPQGDFLTMIILRYAKDLHTLDEFSELNPLSKTKIKIQPRELALAEQLVQSMSSKWTPKQYHDNNKELLLKLIKSDIKRGKSIVDKAKVAKATQAAKKATHKSEKVLDFMQLLKESVATKERHKSHKPSNTRKAHK